MQKFVDDGRAALNPARIEKLSLRTEPIRKNIRHFTPQKASSSSQTRTRTRSSSRDRGDQGQEQAPRKKERRFSNSTYTRDEPKASYAAPQPKKSSYDVRVTDMRYNPEYQRLQRRKEHLIEIEKINQAQDRMREQEQEYVRNAQDPGDRRQHRDPPRLEERPRRTDRKKDSRSRPYD